MKEYAKYQMTTKKEGLLLLEGLGNDSQRRRCFELTLQLELEVCSDVHAGHQRSETFQDINREEA